MLQKAQRDIDAALQKEREESEEELIIKRIKDIKESLKEQGLIQLGRACWAKDHSYGEVHYFFPGTHKIIKVTVGATGGMDVKEI